MTPRRTPGERTAHGVRARIPHLPLRPARTAALPDGPGVVSR
ncbi:hypothetical protein [Streptomyces erythrochromogenes]